MEFLYESINLYQKVGNRQMKVYVKALQQIGSNSVTGEVYSEEGLQYLDGILYGPVREVDTLTVEIANDMINEFENLHPDYKYNHIEFLTK